MESKIKLGLIAVSTMTGLGIQGKSIYDHLRPVKTLVVDISMLNGYAQNPEWYLDGTFVRGFPTHNDIESFIDGLDIVLVTESAYNDDLYTIARSRGVKTVNIQNYEFFGWHNNSVPRPSAFISPSMWHYDDVQKFCDKQDLAHIYLHNPVDRDNFPFKKISKAKRFVHSGGRSAAHDRAGTFTIIDATRYIRSDSKIIIHFQGDQGLVHQRTSTTSDYIEYAKTHGDMSKIEFAIKNLPSPSDIYKLGDVYVQPRRYGGNNIPLGEALSSGLPVIMPDISPNNHLLPNEWLIPAKKIGEFTPRTIIDIYEADAKALAAKIDWFASLSSGDMLTQNKLANGLADDISWKQMLPKYTDFLASLMKS